MGCTLCGSAAHRFGADGCKELKAAVAALRPAARETHEDAVARFLLQFAATDEPVIQLTAEEEADLAAADEEIARGEFATDEEMRAIWAKHGQ